MPKPTEEELSRYKKEQSDRKIQLEQLAENLVLQGFLSEAYFKNDDRIDNALNQFQIVIIAFLPLFASLLKSSQDSPKIFYVFISMSAFIFFLSVFYVFRARNLDFKVNFSELVETYGRAALIEKNQLRILSRKSQLNNVKACVFLGVLLFSMSLFFVKFEKDVVFPTIIPLHEHNYVDELTLRVVERDLRDLIESNLINVAHISGDRVNLRGEPKIGKNIVGTLDKGTVVKVVGSELGWSQVIVASKYNNNSRGWVSNEFLSMF